MMEHKAFMFEYSLFEHELRPILENALASDDSSELRKFIAENLHELRDPYEGDPLGSDWESLIQIRDAHQYGDFALTKYYEPSADLGLGASWEDVQELVIGGSALVESPILGRTIGPRDRPFDPGKAGSYFQDEEQVCGSFARLIDIARNQDDEKLKEAIRMLDSAKMRELGLYVTF